MSRVPDLREVPSLPEEVVQAALDGDLILFVGAGASRLLGMPSWWGMAERQLAYLRERGILNYSELEQLSKLDPKKLLSIADQIAEDNGISLDLTVGLKDYSEGNSIYKSINDIGCVCVTTNYDLLLAPRYINADIPDSTAAIVNRIYKPNEFLVNQLDSPGTVVHLHGAILDQQTMIVTTKQYLTHYDNNYVQTFLGDLFNRKTVLFIGYGLEEAEIMEHILRRGQVGDGTERKRFMLQGYYLSEKPLYEKLHNYYRKSFGVHLVGFVRDHNDYQQQETILNDWGPKIVVEKPLLTEGVRLIDEVFSRG